MGERAGLTKVFEPSEASAGEGSFSAEIGFMPAAPAAVLDIGCGGGDLACLLAPGANLTVALDVSPEVLRAVAAKKQAKGLQRLQLVVADVNRLPFRDACFDYVVSRYTLHHTDLNASLPEVRRVVAPGGRLLLRDIFSRWPKLEPFVAWQVFRILYKAALYAWGKGLRAGWRHLRFNLSRQSLEHVLRENRLVDGPTYRAVHRRWLPGCEFERCSPAYDFWNAPVLKWRNPVQRDGAPGAAPIPPAKRG
jgi:ubiquinone/menaquinone biosynthesis C-methylase UbiE